MERNGSRDFDPIRRLENDSRSACKKPEPARLVAFRAMARARADPM